MEDDPASDFRRSMRLHTVAGCYRLLRPVKTAGRSAWLRAAGCREPGGWEPLGRAALVRLVPMCSCGRAWRETAAWHTRPRRRTAQRGTRRRHTAPHTITHSTQHARHTEYTRRFPPHTTQRLTESHTARHTCVWRDAHMVKVSISVLVFVMAQSDAHRHTHDTHTHTYTYQRETRDMV